MISHLPGILNRTSGMVVEVGASKTLTLALHEMCDSSRRPLITFDAAPETQAMYAERLASEGHRYHSLESLFEARLSDGLGRYGLAVLNVPTQHAIDVLRPIAHVIVIPDARAVRKTMQPFRHMKWIGNGVVASDAEDVMLWDWDLVEEPAPERESENEDERAFKGDHGARLVLHRPGGTSMDMEGFYGGRSCFMVCGGPSAKLVDLSLLSNRGIVSLAVNNAWSMFRPTLWTSVDGAGRFHDVGWKDAGITKIVPYGYVNHRLRVREDDGVFRASKFTVRDMPSVLLYRTNSAFDPNQFLYEPTISIGASNKKYDAIGIRGHRTVMLAAIRLVHYLGFRTIYLVGADCRMTEDESYAFEQTSKPSSVAHNNAQYVALNRRLGAIVPHLKATGTSVFNTTEDSGLDVFEHKSFSQAYDEASRECAKPIVTEGWYDNEMDRAESHRDSLAGKKPVAELVQHALEELVQHALEEGVKA